MPDRQMAKSGTSGRTAHHRGEGISSTDRRTDLLRRLVDSHGVSGCEEQVREVLLGEIRHLCCEVSIDALGNLIGRRMGKGKPTPSVMLAAHMDEVGLFVKRIRPDGYIVFELSGGIDPSILPSQWVRITTSRGGVVRGVISTKGAHFAKADAGGQMTSASSTPSVLFIDIGARSGEEATDMGVRTGDFATYDRSLAISTNRKYFFGKSLDNRIGCTVMVEALRELGEPDDGIIYAVGTVREEIGGIGARVAANSIRPEVAIVLDGLPASDPYVSMDRSPVEIGRGPVIRRAELQIPVASVTPRWLFDLAIKVAEENKIPYQLETASAYYSDASPISAAADGVPTIPILVGRQNSHSPAEIASIDDVDNAIRLTSALARALLAGQGRAEGQKREID